MYLKDHFYLHEEVKRIVEFYCHQMQVSYCQGMLEVLQPFIYMKHVATPTCGSEVDDCFDLACCYAYFKAFVTFFIPNNLHTKFNGRTEVLPYLRCCHTMSDILLAYCDREVFEHFRKRGISVEMYLTEWIALLYTRIVDFSMLYELWEIFLFERDKFFIFYFAVALLSSNREKILSMNSMERVLTFVKSIKVEDYAQLADTYKHAIIARTKTPVSFELLVNRFGIFRLD
jgi:hypothetical protein